MKTAGIIAEYNPFHNGHKYQLQQLREQTGAEYVIVAMSGDFVQRGCPAVVDKYTRAQMALAEGADLVLELPVVFASASAEIFAQGGVALLRNAGADFLGFGAEASENQLPLMMETARLLKAEPPGYRKALRAGLQRGMNFAAARSAAIAESTENTTSADHAANADYSASADHDVIAGNAVSQFITTPNNILAVEYLKALMKWETCDAQKPAVMQPVLIPRIGDGYHTATPGCSYASASAIRRILEREAMDCDAKSCEREVTGFDAKSYEREATGFDTNSCEREATDFGAKSCERETAGLGADCSAAVSAYMPENALQILQSYLRTCPPLGIDDLSSALGFRLLSLREEGYTAYADCSTELSNRIQHSLPEYQSFSQFCHLLKTKELTHSRICRVLLHILLDIRREDYDIVHTFGGGTQPIPYLRVLGFRRASRPLLTFIKKEASAPLITKVADASRILSSGQMHFLKKDLFAADLYMQTIRCHTRSTTRNEYTHGIVLL